MTGSRPSGSPSISAVGPDGHDVVGRAALLLLVELRARAGELDRGHDHVVVGVARTAATDDGALPTSP